MNVDIVWSKLLSKLKDKLSTLSFNTWFSETELYKLQDGKAIIIVPMLIHKRNLGGQYSDLISSLLYEITNSNYELIFCLKEDIEEEEENNNKIEIVEEKIEEKQEDFSYKANSNLNKNYTFKTLLLEILINLHRQQLYLLRKILGKYIIHYFYMEIVG